MPKARRRKSTRSGRRPAASQRQAGPSIRDRAAKLLAGVEGSDEVLSLIDALANERDALMAEHERQKLRIKQLVHLVYGRRTEKLTRDELRQLALEFDATEEQANQDEPDVPGPERPDEQADATEGRRDAKDGRKKKRKRRNRTVVGAEVERIVHEVQVPLEDRNCACCQREMAVIDHVERETLEFIPAKIVVHVERLEKLACRHGDCRKDIHTADRAQDSPQRKVGPSLLAHMVEAKCHDAIPVDRQRAQFERIGVSFPLNTLYSYWRYVTSLLAPVAKVTLAQVLASEIVGVDDTKLRVLDKSRPGGSYKGCLWCFTSGTSPLVAYTFTESWEAEAIAPYIAAIDGFIQCDDYKGYGSVVMMPDDTERVLVPPERRLGCCMHVRRRFHKALKLGDKRAARALELIAALYEVEAEAKDRGLGPDERLALRMQKSVPLMDDFDAWVDQTRPLCIPSSPLAKGLGYAYQQRPFVRRCLTDGRFEIDNGHTERTIRKPCIGRNNYMFTGSPAAAERLAGGYTLVQSAHNLGIPVGPYLLDVITKLEAGWPLRRIGELVPDRWAQLHGPLAARDHSDK